MPQQTEPIDLYFWPTPNGFKPAIMLEELEVPYTVHMIDIGKGDQFTPEFLSLSPNNRIPAIRDPEGPDGAPVSVFESGAILKYLGEKFGRLYPTDWRARIKVDEWLFWQMAGFGPMLGQNHHFSQYAPEKIDYAIKRYRDETHRLYKVLNTQLAGKDYIAGFYSIADIACIGWANSYQKQGIDLDEFPDLKAWHARMNARPAVQRGLAVGKVERAGFDLSADDKARAVLFGQRGS